ncbi:MAG: branched-chain amino acid ABC transporter permease [Firmicutes bacterium]|jgi:branched-chain amino acid transport system permease protein|nr:branched-chain amino acid ABC transporter permease [Bacillota bacterium]HPU01273.1 branched-chain amino acid ABC transporter permease [Bacillota bacterium]
MVKVLAETKALKFLDKRRKWLLVGALLAVAAVFPFCVQSSYLVHVANLALYYSIVAVSLDIVAGFLGEISFGHAGFIAVGAYTTTILNMRVLPDSWISFWIALLAGGLLAALAGVVVGIPAMRISGQYFFVVTMGFGEIIRFILLNWQSVTNGAFGITSIPSPSIGNFVFTERFHYYYLFLVILLLMIITISFLRYSYIGRAWIAIREDELAAEAMGIRLTYYKVLAFSISSFFAGIGGGLLGSYLNFLAPSNFLALESIMILVMVLLGGSGLIYGALFGAFLMTGFNEVLRPFEQYRMLIIGVLMMVLMFLKPRGLLGRE